MIIMIAGTVLVLLILWIVSCRRRLVVMDENINNDMAQIDVQLSACFTALTALLDLIRVYAPHDAKKLIETVKSCRHSVTPIFTAADVLRQEGVIIEVMGRISMVVEQNPNLKANRDYAKCINAVNGYQKMVCTSRLLYNDSVGKLNRELRMFPTSLIGRAFGFRQREYLETVEERRD